jgi:hypothetical protein
MMKELYLSSHEYPGRSSFIFPPQSAVENLQTRFSAMVIFCLRPILLQRFVSAPLPDIRLGESRQWRLAL